jgi:hypothetical protein
VTAVVDRSFLDNKFYMANVIPITDNRESFKGGGGELFKWGKPFVHFLYVFLKL